LVVNQTTTQTATSGVPIRRASATWWRGYTAVLAVTDTLAMVLGVVAAQWLWFGRFHTVAPLPHRLFYGAITLTLIPAWLVTLTLCGTYERRYLEAGADEYRQVFTAAVRFLAVVATAGFVFKVSVARGFVAVAIPVATLAALGGRYAARRWLHRRRAVQQRCMKGCLVVGSDGGVADLARALRGVPFTGYAIVGACTPVGEGTIDVDGQSVPVVAGTDSILSNARRTGVDAIVVADGSTLPEGTLPALAWQLEGTGIELLVAPAVTDVAGPRISIRPVAGLPLVHVEEPELSGVRRLAKNAFDRSLAAMALVVLSPILLLVGAAIRLTSRGPALFRQVRIGVGGRRFVMWKFRTMTIDAEDRLAELAELNEHDGLLFKILDDPRQTRLGRILRRWSIDELPQLWNVVRGEMSIVGPRPPLPTEVERYDDKVRRRLLVKPGLTGLWQVSGRAQLSWDEAVRLDLYYIENWSPSLDAVILAKTLVAVVRRQGAC
jgi:exopolysaccharide biosynthesis polyprenyl glycosylphosphotransferase